MAELKTEPETQLERGSSLWADAWRRLLKNRAAMIGGGVVLFMAICALAFPFISAHITQFTFDEQHLAAEPKPIGARSIPEIHYALDETTIGQFAQIDVSGDGRIDHKELSKRLCDDEFARLDTSGNGLLDAGELEAAPVNLLHDSGAFTIKRYDTDHDGGLSPAEAVANDLTDILRPNDAAYFIQGLDGDTDGALSVAEFKGLPLPATHYFGTDELGRDLLTRVVMGARVSLAVGFVATLVSLLIGVLYGATAGFLGGRVDNLMMRFVDVMYGLPFMFLVILLFVIFEDVPKEYRLYLLFAALGAVQWLTMSRIVRGQVITLKGQEFIEAARAIGVSKTRIILRHLIPNALGPIIVYATLTVPAVMLEEAFLSFLGLGVQEPFASWGSLASEGAKAFREYPWLIIFPGAALALTLLSLNFLGDGLRDALDPKVQKD